MCLIVFSLICQSSWGSYISDQPLEIIESYSPSKQFLVTAYPPDLLTEIKSQYPRSNFVYACMNTPSGETLWIRERSKQWENDHHNRDNLPREGNPSEIFVSNDGWTVILTKWDELICVSPEGIETCCIRLHHNIDAFNSDEREKYLTSGPYDWIDYSQCYFAQVGEKPLFVINCWWDKRLIIDLNAGSIIEPTEAMLSTLKEIESSLTISTLEHELAEIQKGLDSCGGYPISSPIAIVLAGRLRLQDSIPLLRKLEKLSFIADSVLNRLIYDYTSSLKELYSVEISILRQAIHLSLRRLGQKPRVFPCTYIRTFESKFVPDPSPDSPDLYKTRAGAAQKICENMTPEDVVNLIGFPDFVLANRTYTPIWEYDIDAFLPYTLILHWGENGVSKVKIIMPPLWATGTVREHSIFNDMLNW